MQVVPATVATPSGGAAPESLFDGHVESQANIVELHDIDDRPLADEHFEHRKKPLLLL